MQLLEFFGQMGKPAAAIADQQHVQLVIHIRSIKRL